jgi:Fe2+ or Zn2+ uptake regulation protein
MRLHHFRENSRGTECALVGRRIVDASSMCTADKSKITRDVLAYLVDHQDAQDTLEGIVEWWLVEQKIKQQTATVKEALRELVKKKYLLELRSVGSRTRYRINQLKSKEIMTFVAESRRQASDNSPKEKL